MAEITSLNPVVLVDSDDPVLIVDDSTWAEAQQVTRANLLASETNPRIAADTAIRDGAGLESDGSLTPWATSNYLKNADFVAAGLNVNLKNGLELLDVAIGNLAGSVEITVQVTLTSAEILNLNTAPVVKHTAPGAGKYYSIRNVSAWLTFVSTAYASFGANGIYMRFNGGTDPIVHFPKTFLESAATLYKHFEVLEHTLGLNASIEYFAPDGNPTLGDGTITIRATYVIVDTATVPTPLPDCCVTPVTGTFTSADLTAAGNLEINHQLNTQFAGVLVIFDNNNQSTVVSFARGDESGLDLLNYVTVPIGPPATVPGTWSYVLIGVE